ncbi:MAG: lamin tail domain-containing protein, partial [Bacteroidales bacterium]|nr:lamin tail domain-containing protein [Bacteroidales bacterium]
NYTGLTAISSVSLQANQTDVHVNLSTALTNGQTYNLTINNVKDTAQNVMDSAQTFAILYQATVPPFNGIPNLVITEINYNGPEGGTDTTEFIEIYNNDTVAVNMAGFYFVEGVTYTFPQVVIGVGQYFVLAYDSVKVNNFFNIASYKWTSGGLSNGGEDLLLVTSSGDTIDYVNFDDGGSWPSSPDGYGPSLTLCNVNSDNSLAANWSASTTFAGVNAAGDSIFANPGAGCGFVPPPTSDTIPPVVVSATPINASTIDVIYNEMVDNSATIMANYTGISSVSTISLSSNGKTATLSLSTPMTNGMSYSLTISNISDTAGNIMVIPQTFNFIFNNSQADLIFTEIMYNDLSESDSLEYFEIFNKGTANADISGYQVSDGIEYTFPQNTIMTPGSYLVIAKDSALVNSVFGITGTHQWTSGGLKNSGEAIEIVNTNAISVAKVEFSDQSPWAVEADGDGPSLEFCDKNLANNNGANWTLSKNFITTFNGDSIFGTPKSDCILIGIAEIESNISLNIFPNPANNIVYLSSSVEMNQIQVFDANGNQVVDLQINSNNLEIDLSSFESGLYFIRTIFANGTLSKSSKLLLVR